jgi:hypothetical protein
MQAFQRTEKNQKRTIKVKIIHQENAVSSSANSTEIIKRQLFVQS